MNSRQTCLTATACLLLAGALIYGLNLTKPEIAPEFPASASVGSRRTASPSPLSPGSASTDAPARKSAETTVPSADESVRKSVANPRRTPADGAARAESSPPPHPRITKPDRESRESVAEEPLEQALADVPAAQPPVGLRLAQDVRLPVAAMPHDLKITPIAQQALEQIVADYYRDLAAGLKNQPSGDTPEQTQVPLEESETGELTQIITNGPATDAARERADYRFKALFGNAAYNRLTMKAVLELQAPVTLSE